MKKGKHIRVENNKAQFMLEAMSFTTLMNEIN